MSFLRGGKKIIVGLGLAGCGAAAAVIFSGLNDSNFLKAKASTFLENHFLNEFQQPNHKGFLIEQPVPKSKWDSNWDKRDPEALVKPLIRGKFREEKDENKYNEKIEKAKAVASRHLLLIRHGQYNMDGETDALRKLSPLGREQAEYIARRLRDLNLPFTRIVQSTMTRATETASIISKLLPDVPVSSCDFLREGSPILPDPPVHHWRPEQKVNISSLILT